MSSQFRNELIQIRNAKKEVQENLAKLRESKEPLKEALNTHEAYVNWTKLSRRFKYRDDDDHQTVMSDIRAIFSEAPKLAESERAIERIRAKLKEVEREEQTYIEIINNYERREEAIDRQLNPEVYIERERIEQEALKARYDDLVRRMNDNPCEIEYYNISRGFRDMNGYADTATLADECTRRHKDMKNLREEQERIERERLAAKEKRAEARRRFGRTIALGTELLILRELFYKFGHPFIILGIHFWFFSMIYFRKHGNRKIWVCVFSLVSFLVYLCGSQTISSLFCAAGSVVVAILALIYPKK